MIKKISKKFHDISTMILNVPFKCHRCLISIQVYLTFPIQSHPSNHMQIQSDPRVLYPSLWRTKEYTEIINNLQHSIPYIYYVNDVCTFVWGEQRHYQLYCITENNCYKMYIIHDIYIAVLR